MTEQPAPEDLGDDILESIEGVGDGVYEVTTWNYSRHLVDLDRRTIVRVPAEGREWPHLVADLVEIRFTHFRGCTVGQSMYIELEDGTWRLSSTIRSIRRVVDPDAYRQSLPLPAEPSQGAVAIPVPASSELSRLLDDLRGDSGNDQDDEAGDGAHSGEQQG